MVELVISHLFREGCNIINLSNMESVTTVFRSA